MEKPQPLVSGEWQQDRNLTDYRAEWLSNVLVERATWQADAPVRRLAEVVADIEIAGPGYVWLRFWLRDEDQVVEKYFDADGKVIGFFVPVCMPFRQEGNHLESRTLALALWHDTEGRLTILGERDFEVGSREHVFAPIEMEHAEHRIRALTLGILNRSFPPGLVRNFSIAPEQPPEPPAPESGA